MKLITGASDVPNVTSNNDGEFNQGIWGDGLVVLANGSKLGYELTGNNTVRIKDGDLVFQGRHALIEAGQYDNISLTQGRSGYNRLDLIVVHYELGSNGYETLELRVISGTETTGTPTAPSYVLGNIRTGSTIAEAPLYEVLFTGTNVSLRLIPTVYDSILTQVTSKQPIINGAISNVTNANLQGGRIVTTSERGKLDVSEVTSDKLVYLNGLNANIQSQINAKQDEITGAITSVVSDDLNPSKAVVTDENGKISASNVSAEKIGFLANVSSDIQAQLDARGIEKGSTWNAERVVFTDENKKVTTGNATKTELGYLSGVTSSIQSQLDGKAKKGSTWNTKRVTYTNDNKEIVTSNVSDTELGYLQGTTSKIQTQLNKKPDKGSTWNTHRVAVTNDNKEVITSNISDTELGCLSGISSNVQTQLNGKQPNIGGAASTIASNNLTANRALISNNNGKVAVSATTNTELGYVHGVTSAIQTQLNGKASISNWDTSRVMISNKNGNLTASSITTTELGYLDGVSSNIQTQLNGKVSISKLSFEDNYTLVGGNVNVPSSKETTLANTYFNAGVYQVNIYVTFSAVNIASSSLRSVWLATTSSGDAMTQAHIVQVGSGSGGTVKVCLSCVITPTKQQTYYIRAWQNSGGSLTASNIRMSWIGLRD